MNILERAQFITEKLVTSLDNYLHLISLQEKNWSEEENSIAKEHINNMNIQLKALILFEEDFKTNGIYNLNVHLNNSFIDFLNNIDEFKTDKNVLENIEKFKEISYNTQPNKEYTIKILDDIEITADTILRLLK